MALDGTDVVYTFFGLNYLYFTQLRGNVSEIVGKESRGLFLKGPMGLLGVSGVKLRSKTSFIKLSSMAHHLAVFFGGESIFEDLFNLFQLFWGLMGLSGVFRVPKGPKKFLIKPLSMAHEFSLVFSGEYKF